MARPQRLILAVVLLVVVAASCGNSKSGASNSGGPTVAAPTDGGAAHRTEHVAISGVPGVSDTEIAYALVGTKQNNPLGTCILDCYRAGIEAYFAWRNSQGGIYGRKLVVQSVTDDQLAKNQQASLAVISQKKAFGALEAGLFQEGWGDLNDAGVPTYTWGIDAGSAANREAVFPSTVIRCSDCQRRILPYIAQKSGAKKVGVLGYGVSPNSKDCADSDAASVKAYAKDTGVQLAYLRDDLPYGLPNGIGPEVTAMKQAGVGFIATCLDLNAMKTLAQEVERQGLKAVLFHPNTYDQAFVKAAGRLFEGNYVDVQFRPFEANAESSSLDAFKTWMGKAHQTPTELAMVGWINASTAYAGLLAAGPRFDRAKVIAATNAMKDYTADGLIPATNWSEAHTPYTQATRASHAEPECASVVKVVNGEFQTMAPKDKPWLCWKSQSAAWSEPVPTDFH